MKSRLLLTGVTGLVGSSVVVALVRDRREYEFVCLVRGGGGMSARERAEAALREECAFERSPELADEVLTRVSVVECDISTMDPVALAADPALVGVEEVFHCAADVNLGKDPSGKVVRANYGGTENMIALAKSLGVRAFHYVSTAYVAGKTTGVATEEAATGAAGFNNPYEESKSRSEALVRAAGIPFTIYRPAIIVGRAADGAIRRPLAFYRVLELLVKMKRRRALADGVDPSGRVSLPMRIASATSARVYFVPIDFVQAAIVALVGRPPAGATYHLTGDSPVSVSQIVEAVREVMGIDGIAAGPGAGDETAEGRMFSRFIGDLFPYFSCDVEFAQDRIRRDWPACEGRTYGMEELKRMIGAYCAAANKSCGQSPRP